VSTYVEEIKADGTITEAAVKQKNAVLDLKNVGSSFSALICEEILISP
jgi:hypothetical protein